jgi:acetyl esterase/lipase
MRVLDALAAGRWVQKQGARADATFLAGDSQGGWTVLRTFTNHNLADAVRAHFVAGIAQYPNCYVKTSRWFGAAPTGERDPDKAPPLGNYTRPVLVFTGGKDEATPLSQCEPDTVFAGTQWKHFPQATHAYDSPNRGIGRAAVHGECAKAANVYNRFPVCHDAEVTAEALGMTFRFLEANLPEDLKTPQ